MLKKIKSNARNWVMDHKKRLTEGNITKLTMCKKCFTFYYKNSWHFEKPRYLEENQEQEIPVRFTECPACMEQELAFYETESNLVLGRG